MCQVTKTAVFHAIPSIFLHALFHSLISQHCIIDDLLPNRTNLHLTSSIYIKFILLTTLQCVAKSTP